MPGVSSLRISLITKLKGVVSHYTETYCSLQIEGNRKLEKHPRVIISAYSVTFVNMRFFLESQIENFVKLIAFLFTHFVIYVEKM